jgi:hypothetical protein
LAVFKTEVGALLPASTDKGGIRLLFLPPAMSWQPFALKVDPDAAAKAAQDEAFRMVRRA